MELDEATDEKKVAKLYASLPLVDGNKIRVLDLLPRRKGKEISANLRVTTLDDSLEYEALSYTWGATTKRHTILLNDQVRMPVTDNLFQALFHLRYRFRIRTIWVDALCINQANEVEKGHQVRLMGRIYESARWVNAWLGEPEAVVAPNLRRLLLLRELFSEDGTIFSWKLFRMHAEAFESALINSSPRWHDRAWVAQEFILARKIYLCYGRRRIKHSKLDYSLYYKDRRYGTTYLSDLNDRIWEQWDRPDNPWINESVDNFRNRCRLHDRGLRAIADCAATDPRDRVYSVLGFINEQEAALVAPDYSNPTWQVFAKATFASLKFQQGHDILQNVGLGQRKQSLMPSWAVDFADTSKLVEAFAYTTEGDVNETLNAPLQNNDLFWLDASDRTLFFKGHDFGAVAEILPLTFGSVLNTQALGEVEGDSMNLSLLVGTSKDIVSREILSDDSAEMLATFIMKAIRKIDAATNSKKDIATNHLDLDVAALQNCIPPTIISDAPLTDKFRRIWTDRRLSQLQSLFNASTLKGAPEQALFTALGKWEEHALGISQDTTCGGDLEAIRATIENVQTFGRYATAAANGCSLFMTKNGMLGLATSSVAPGDKIVLGRARWAFLILRPVWQRYEFKGLALIHCFDMYPSTSHLRTEDLAKWMGITQARETFKIQ